MSIRAFGNVKYIGKKQFLPIYSDVPDSFQIDLTFFQSMKNLNDGYWVLFTAININTRFAYAYEGKNKNKETILGFLVEMMKKTNINSITCDEGSEFISDIFKAYCAKHNILVYYVNNDKYKLGIVNRLHRTIKDKLREIIDNDDEKFRWIDHIHKIIKDYNSHVNRGIGCAPKDVNSFIEQQIIKAATERTQILKDNYKPFQVDFRVDDYINVRRERTQFTDKLLSTYLKTVYKIIKVENNSLVVVDPTTKTQNSIIVKKTDCILVPKTDVIIETKKSAHEEEIVKNKIAKKLKAVGIDEENIRTSGRERRANTKYADFV